MADDGLLQELRNDMPVSRWPACARRLQLAAECMDEAAVFTIHGWCQRMLREHAFDSRGLFDLTLSDDTSSLLAEACRDYWRVFCQGLDHEAAVVLHGWWDSPESLQAAVSDLLEKGMPCRVRGCRRHRRLARHGNSGAKRSNGSRHRGGRAGSMSWRGFWIKPMIRRTPGSRRQLWHRAV